MKHVVCFSGGHSSALAAIETVRRYGRENTILLNHDISDKVEDRDVKRFKNEVADHLGVPISYANRAGFQSTTPLSLCREKGMIRFGAGNSICTYYLKTEPFNQWLMENYPVKRGEISNKIILVYGFDAKESIRIERRRNHLLSRGYLSEYPLTSKTSICDTRELGIDWPETYAVTKHANCRGCLKAGRQHWYMVYCLWPDIFWEAVETEQIVGYSILRGYFLEDLLPMFQKMQECKIKPNDNDCSGAFWSNVRKKLKHRVY